MPYSPNDSWDQVIVNPGLCSRVFLVFHSSIQFWTDLCPSDLVSWRGHKIGYTRVGRLISLLVKMYAWAHARSLFIGFFVEVLTICKQRLASIMKGSPEIPSSSAQELLPPLSKNFILVVSVDTPMIRSVSRINLN